MAVGLRGFTQGSTIAGSASLAWPSGTVAGDVALLHADPELRNDLGALGPQTAGWAMVGRLTWVKVLTAADVASALPVRAMHVKLQTFSGAAGVGRVSSQAGLTVQYAGSGVWWDGSRASATVAPATYRLGAEWRDGLGQYQAAFFMTAGAGYVALPSAAADGDWWAYEVLPASVPSAPVLGTPGPAQHVDRNQPARFTWAHQSVMPQTGYKLRIGGPAGGYVTASGTLSASEVSVSSTEATAVVNAGVLSSLYGATWAVSTQSSAGWGPWSEDRVLYADTPPSAIALSVAASAGDLSPTVTWSNSSGESAGSALPVTAHRVRVTPATATAADQGVIYDSGVVQSTATTHDVAATTAWTLGGSYKAWVTVYAAGLSSSSASSAFVMTWTPPSTPTLTAVAGDPPMVTVAGLTVGAPVQVEQQLDGATWTLLASRTAESSSLTVGSPLALTGGTVSFRARQGAVVDGVPQWSAWTAERTNLCTNSSFESGTAGWTTINLSGFTSGATNSGYGARCALAVGAGNSTTPRFRHVVPVAAGQTITASGYLLSAGTAPAGRVADLVWLDAGGATVGSAVISSATWGAAWWGGNRAIVTGTAPTGATQVRVQIGANYVANMTGAQTLYLDGVLIERNAGATPGAYFDGSTPGASWTGDPHASTSLMHTAVTVPVAEGSYLVDDADRTRYLRVGVRGFTARVVQGIRRSYGLGASCARVDYSPAAGRTGTLLLRVDSLDERDALLRWLDERRAWWVVLPIEPSILVARVTAPAWDRVAPLTLSPKADLPIEWVEQL